MSNDFYDSYSITDEVKLTIDRQYINDNTLRTNSFGDSVVSPSKCQWWVDPFAKALYIRNIENTAWEPVFDLGEGENYIKDSQIKTEHISDNTRKGSIVEGESIAPAACTLQRGGAGGIVPQSDLPRILDPHKPYVSSVSGPPVIIDSLNTMVWIHSDAAFIKAKAELSTTKITGESYFRFRVGLINSSIINVVGNIKAWSSEEAVCDVASLEGWHQMSFFLSNNFGYLAPATLHGCVMRWDQ